LLAQVDLLLHPVDARDDEVHSWFQRLAIPAEPLYVPRARLRDDPDRAHHGNDDDNHHDRGDDGCCQFHGYSRG